MQGIHKLNVTWKDDNHARIQNPDDGAEFDITIRPKTNMFAPNGRPVKPRLYVGGPLVRQQQEKLSHRKQIAWAKEHFVPTLEKIINRPVEIKFSSKAGCSCGCSPGFIIEDDSIPFDIWMDTK